MTTFFINYFVPDELVKEEERLKIYGRNERTLKKE